MPFGTLFTTEANYRTIAILAVAKANNLDLKIEYVVLGSPTAEHLVANPLGKIPAFIGEDGFALSECIAISVYVTSQNEKTTLLGKTKQDYVAILRYMSFFNSEICPHLDAWWKPLIGKSPYNKKAVDDASKSTLRAIDAIEKHLTDHTYLVGERITLADLFCAGALRRGFQHFFDKQWCQEHPAVARWYETVVNQPIYSAVAEKLPLLEKPALTNVAPKKPEQPKPAAAPKPAPAAKPAADEEDEPAAAPKPKHPLEALPKASLPIDEWKRQYSNSETPDALKWFWENVNFEEYSLWKVNYKYNNELTLTFMSNNLIGGLNNRLEASRKYLFGCASVYGENNNSVIQGAFVIRGQEHLPVFDVAPDYESYEFIKLDSTKPEDRAFVEAQWSWDKPATVDGKEYPHVDGKVFK